MISKQTDHHPVIVVGCGPVGLLVAINLARQAVPVLILERSHQIDQSPRAASYQPCSQAELLETGALEDIRKESIINDIQSFWVGKERVAYVEKKEGGKLFPSGINCPQPTLAKILLEHLVNKYSAVVKFNQKVIAVEQDGESVIVTAVDPTSDKETTYVTDWLVGCDGAGSGVRKFSNIDFEGFSWPKENFVATNVRFDFRKYGYTTGNFIMDPVHWAVVAVLDDTGLWRVAFGVKAGMTNDEIRAELDEHYKHIFPVWPAEYKLEALNKYTPHQRCASTFRKGRVLLAGDAAHSNNPIGGLGLTTGILDAGPLGRALAAVINGKAPDSLLDKWAHARRDKWLNFTNQFSIEHKRMVQRAGYSDDPWGIWKMDDVAKEHKMEKWIGLATPEKEAQDREWYKSLEDPQAQMMSRIKQWNITMDPRWMEEYEDPKTVEWRISLRPANLDVGTIA